MISYQSVHGSWPKNVDTARQPYRGDVAKLRGTFDNGAARGELRRLARAYRAIEDPRCLRALNKGLDHILLAQYANGGWPQTHPPGRGYARHITFNDGAMVGLMTLLRDVAEIEHERRNGYSWCGTWGETILREWPRWKQTQEEFRDPPREFSVMPFWFWNDTLTEEALIGQIADFEAHGVYGFVIHPRVGLPRDIGWMSPRMMHFMKVAVAEAKRRGMSVVLYDEGMYPSGSSSGQVVARNPAHAARGLVKMDLDPGQEPKLQSGWNLVAVLKRPNGRSVAVIDRPSGGVIRGIHYMGEGPQEEKPPAADILNPAAVASFVTLVYERFAEELGDEFGKTILGIFTDEPSMTGRGGRGIPGTAGILPEVNRILGYDFTPHLADLWYDDRPDSARHRADYHRAVAIRLEETFYQPLSQWCQQHGLALTGHPAGSMDIGMERYFQIPGQDLVWRYVTPGPKALEGEHSTMAKCASSAMVHLGRRRNSNELYGAYGHELTFDEMEWLANWCFVRGHNLLYPHAFYYSVTSNCGTSGRTLELTAMVSTSVA